MSEAIQEFVDSRGVALRVDHSQGVLRGVKLIGLASRNGRRYRQSALEQAKPLYEGAKVNVNHPKDGPLSPRDYQDRLGVIRGVEFRDSEGLFADLHFNPKHPLAEQLAWDAEHNPRNVGFSHNVLARLSRDGDSAVVEEITRVQSVDLVADPAATLGLYEQSESLPSWDALSLELLEIHRPDLLEAVRSSATDQLQKLLEQKNAESARLTRRQRVIELLCEHGLPIPSSTGRNLETADAANRAVSSSFFEMLTRVEDEAELEQLVVERAELERSALRWPNGVDLGPPRSRDQLVVQTTGTKEEDTSAEFAKSLKLLSA